MTSLGKIESTAMLLHSLTYLPRASQCHLCSNHLILCLGLVDCIINFALAIDLGFCLVHIDTPHAKEIVNTVMAMIRLVVVVVRTPT